MVLPKEKKTHLQVRGRKGRYQVVKEGRGGVPENRGGGGEKTSSGPGRETVHLFTGDEKEGESLD